MKIELRYDGPALATHVMDVRDLAPALLAFGELCREANKLLNGNKATVNVLVHADLKANCVTISFEVVQTILNHAKSLFGDDGVQNAEAILSILGIIGGHGLLQYLGLFKDKAVEQTSFESRDSDGNIFVTINGDGNSLTINQQTLKLAESKKLRTAAKDISAPVANCDGIDEATFLIDKRPELNINKQLARNLQEVAPIPEDDNEPSYVTGHIVVHEGVFDPESAVWGFEYDEKIEKIDISQTNIARDAYNLGRICKGDTYKVKMRVTEKKVGRGFKNHYTIVEVLDFIPGVDRET